MTGSKKPKPKANVRLRKIVAPAPEKRVVELEIDGDEDFLPQPESYSAPVEVKSTSFWSWLKSIF
jgi:hypothetical protein